MTCSESFWNLYSQWQTILVNPFLVVLGKVVFSLMQMGDFIRYFRNDICKIVSHSFYYLYSITKNLIEYVGL